MRFSFLQGFNSGLEGILRIQKQNFDTQAQISSGRRILTPADDPVASARIIQINQELSQIDQFVANAKAVESRLSLEETPLSAATNILFRIRELASAANGAATIQDDRILIAAEVDARLDELVSLANTRDPNGEYIFSGYQGSVRPFEQNTEGTYTYFGDDGQRLVNIATSTSVPISDSGKAVFVDIPSAVTNLQTSVGVGAATISSATISDRVNYDANANYPEDYVIRFTGPATFDLLTRTDFIDGAPDVPVATGMPYTSGTLIDFNTGVAPAPVPPLGFELTITGAAVAGDTYFVDTNQTQSIMDTLGQLAEGLKNLSDSAPDALLLDALVANTLINLDSAEANLSQVKAQIGARQNTVDSVRDLNEGVELINQQILSEIRDLDYAEAISRLSLETFLLEASQQSFAKVSNLSLFNFIR